MIEELILNPQCYRCKFDEILFFAPYEIGTDLELDKDNYRNVIDIEWVKNKIDSYN